MPQKHQEATKLEGTKPQQPQVFCTLKKNVFFRPSVGVEGHHGPVRCDGKEGQRALPIVPHGTDGHVEG